MKGREPPPSLDKLEARLQAARARRAPERGEAKPEPSAIGIAFRVGVELVSAVIVGVGIGYLLDALLGTGPWLLVLFLFLGTAAGILNVYRSTRDMGLAERAEEGNHKGAPEEREDGG